MKTVIGESYEQRQAELAASLFEKIPENLQEELLDVMRMLVSQKNKLNEMEVRL